MISCRTQKLHALVIDDDELMLELIGFALKKLSFKQIFTAQKGTEGLSILDDPSSKVDIVFCDLNMPEMSGAQVMRYLSDRDFEGGIIFVSGEGSSLLNTAENLAQVHGLNIVGSLAKPFRLKNLSCLIERFLSKKNISIKKRTRTRMPIVNSDDLSAAIKNSEIDVVFQPKVTMSELKVIGVETLARWYHKEKGFIGPDVFIPIAEENDLINALTDSIFTKALKQGGEWHRQGYDLKIAVNLSLDSLDNFQLPTRLALAVQDHGLENDSIILEITESRLMQNIKLCLEVLMELRLKGFELSIDDFGTGYSSLEQVHRIPCSEIKLDRLFVNAATSDPQAYTILESSIQMAKRLDLSTVAEGIETSEEWRLLAQMGCDQVQGYYVAKPMPGDHFTDWLEKWDMRSRLKIA